MPERLVPRQHLGRKGQGERDNMLAALWPRGGGNRSPCLEIEIACWLEILRDR